MTETLCFSFNMIFFPLVQERRGWERADWEVGGLDWGILHCFWSLVFETGVQEKFSFQEVPSLFKRTDI